MKIQDRFIEYIKIDTQSAYNPKSVPSTEKQRDLAVLLERQLKEMGAKDVYISDECCLYGRMEANYENCKAPKIGFCAHMDTTPELCGKDINPRIVENYDGKDIVLNEEAGIVMERDKFDHLGLYVGDDLIVTDGLTLLGADDKAGAAEIMQMLEYFYEHPEVKHGEIQLFFTPDEEVGCLGANIVDTTRFNPDFAYTLDAYGLGEYSYECFNAAAADVAIKGVNIHPGLSKNQMKNAILIANEYLNMLPEAETPSHTEMYEGYYHVLDFSGEVELTTMRFYIRDFDRNGFENRKEQMHRIADFLNFKYGEGTVSVKVTDTYYNMAEKILPNFEIVEAMKEGMEKAGFKPYVKPMRGGTDGSVLSQKGIPTPNMCDGSHNCHGRYEYVSIKSMEKITEAIANIVTHFAV